MEKEIDLLKIYESARMDDFNNINLSDEDIVILAMKEAVELALDMAAEEALADVETGVKTTLCDMCPEYDAVVNKQSILALKSRIK